MSCSLLSLVQTISLPLPRMLSATFTLFAFCTFVTLYRVRCLFVVRGGTIYVSFYGTFVRCCDFAFTLFVMVYLSHGGTTSGHQAATMYFLTPLAVRCLWLVHLPRLASLCLPTSVYLGPSLIYSLTFWDRKKERKEEGRRRRRRRRRRRGRRTRFLAPYTCLTCYSACRGAVRGCNIGRRSCAATCSLPLPYFCLLYYTCLPLPPLFTLLQYTSPPCPIPQHRHMYAALFSLFFAA